MLVLKILTCILLWMHVCHYLNAYPKVNTKISDSIDVSMKSAYILQKNPNALTNSNPIKIDDDNVQQLIELETATPKPFTIELNDIFISVKTSKIFHQTRLNLIIDTWFQLANEQTWFFTDDDDKFYQNKTNGHLINTNCAIGHNRMALCCKMSVEIDTFLDSMKKWFCHFDDDNYVNVAKLINLLNEYNPVGDWYLGKPSIAKPLELHLQYKNHRFNDAYVKFLFATGGAGFCMSRALVLRMAPIVSGGKLISVCNRIGFPDDVTIGFVIEYLLGVPLTIIDEFHSHLEQLEYIKSKFSDQVSLSYGQNDGWNVIKIDGLNKSIDPTRFRSLHCHLFSHIRSCVEST